MLTDDESKIGTDHRVFNSIVEKVAIMRDRSSISAANWPCTCGVTYLPLIFSLDCSCFSGSTYNSE